MKKSLLLLLAAFATLAASAQTKVEIDGIWYNLTSETQQAEVTFKGNSYNEYSNEYSGSINIPATVTYEGVSYSVTSIGEGAFRSCSSLTAITIPEGVTSIGAEAFAYCRSLTTITLPEGVTSIGDYAFSYCSSLTAITIPEGVTSIGSYAFQYCSSLTAILIPKSVTSIENRAFKNSGIAYLTILGKPTIENEAFAGCSKLTDIYCYSEEVPTAKDNAYSGLDLSRITLHVPERALKAYKNTEPWCRFGTIVAIK